MTGGESVCYGACIAWAGRHRVTANIQVHRRRKILDTHGLIRANDESHNVTTTLDLVPSGIKRVKSFAFFRVARIVT